MQIKNIVFMGTPRFAVPTLELLAKTRFRPVLCITQPDRPKGRKQQLMSPEVKLKADELGIEVIQPEDVNDVEVLSRLQKLKPEVIVTAAYGGYLKKEIRRLPVWGCLNLHPSLLPKYRGSAPVNFALFNGDAITGNTIFRIVAKMDAGPICFQSKMKIEDADCYTSLYEKLAIAGAEDLLHVLEQLEKDEIEPVPQDEEKATFSSKLEHPDFLLDWHTSARQIRNKVRGLAEVPGAVAAFRGKRIKVIEVEILSEKADSAAGTITEIIKNAGIKVCTEDFQVLVKKVQPAGKQIMTAHAFSLGARIEKNEKIENGF
ncbi:MAG TPA: methionyl-tRNA formyltransferase [Candidatus Cloacimonadota bacterium]|nr:methionyl-tRNA formyltransferase [Candidatus Cloacimonadota bacterium]